MLLIFIDPVSDTVSVTVPETVPDTVPVVCDSQLIYNRQLSSNSLVEVLSIGLFSDLETVLLFLLYLYLIVITFHYYYT